MIELALMFVILIATGNVGRGGVTCPTVLAMVYDGVKSQDSEY